MDFKKLIEQESKILDDLHSEIHRTVANRNRSKYTLQVWHDACSAFHSYVSKLDPYLDRACSEEKYFDLDLIEFVVSFLEVDAWFFRSGYLKQIIITRLKRSELTEPLKQRLRLVLLDAVNRRGTREFKYYCRLAIPLADLKLVAELETARKGKDTARANRAKLMIKRIELHSNIRSLT